jgi:ribosomal-protein-alanine N-acetyltransferase
MFFSSSGIFFLKNIETPRLQLRRLERRDAQDIYAYSKDPDVARYVLWQAQSSVSEAREYIRYMLGRYRRDEPSSWGIIDKMDGHLIGTIGYMNYDMENGVVEIGYSLAKWKWNQGYMTEALEKVIEYTFETMDVNRIEAMHEPENPASGRVMEKCGFKKEGLLRQRLYNKGKYVDVCLYSLLRGEWNSKERRSIE